MAPARLLRGTIMHVPRDPFRKDGALEAFSDGALAIEDGVVSDVGDYPALAVAHPDAVTDDRRGAVIVPGLVDAHVHYPQMPVMGAAGMGLLEWLERRTLPEEARYARRDYAATRADAFLRLLAANGTTTAMVFGAHFAPAMDAFFAAAERSGLRITAGLCVSDRNLTEALHTTPARALDEGLELARRWHGRDRLRYAVTPRFAVSCSDALLEACGELLAAVPGAYLTTHINESQEEVAAVRHLFPEALDYLDAYDRHGLIGMRSLLAHDVHVGERELARLADADAVVVHCPSSNLMLGSGLFPLRRHLAAGVRLALGTDVGAGTGFGLLGETLAGQQVQMLRADGERLGPARALYLATAAGAAALGMADRVGDFRPGKQADLVVLRPPPRSTLAELLALAADAESALGAVLMLAREESVEEVLVSGASVLRGPPPGAAGLDAVASGGP
ncbi:MAG: guanine deaminase [Deinococcales bacterium]